MKTLYRIALLSLPREFRQRHGISMEEQFEQQVQLLAKRPLARAIFVMRAIADALAHGVALRMSSTHAAPRSSAWPSDMRQAWRSMTSRKMPSALSVGLLAMALVVATSTFCIVDALIIRPAPFPRPNEVVAILMSESAEKPGGVYMQAGTVRLWEQETDAFASIGAFMQAGTMLVGAPDTQREPIGFARADSGFFDALGVRPLIGRTISADDVREGRDRVVVISESVWRAQFNRDPAVIGRSLIANDGPLTVIGVMPEWFAYPHGMIKLWVPLDLTQPLGGRSAEMVARLPTGVSRRVTDDKVRAAGIRVAASASPALKTGVRKSRERRGGTGASASTRQSVEVLGCAALLLLLTAAANLSTLTMTEIHARTRDMAVQSALGASRFRLVRQALIEQGLIATFALAIAAPLTWLTISAAQSLMPDRLTGWTMHTAAIDGRSIAMMIALAVLIPLTSAIFPALAGSKMSVVGVLKHDSRASTSSRSARWTRQGLVIAELASAVVLLVAGALLVRSFLRLEAVDRGFDSTRLAYVQVRFVGSEFPSALSRRLFMDRASATLAAVPGVAGVTIASGMPPASGQTQFGRLEAEGAGVGPRIDLPGYFVAPNFFSVTGIPIVQGRAFSRDDTADNVIISESMATTYWPGRSAVGQRLKFSDDKSWMNIVGVAHEVRSGGLDDSRGAFEIYYPLARPDVSAVSAEPVSAKAAYSGTGTLVVRVPDAARAVSALRQAIVDTDRRVVIASVVPVESLYAKSLEEQRMLLVLMIGFSAAGVALSAVGVYGVLSGIVSQQMKEIGVRIMLGAEPRAMSHEVFRRGLTLAAVGGVVGVAIALASGRLMSSVLFHVDPNDVMSYAVVIGVLTATTVVAAWWPAARASRVDPVSLLRDS